MSPEEILAELAELAQRAGLRVRVLVRAPGVETELTSAVCRVRGETWVVLARADPLAERIALLASALRTHAGDWLDGQYLPPAVRAHLERARPLEGGDGDGPTSG
jgi:hypothetical protein